MHTPVLLKEVIEGLNIKKNGKYIDATFGLGGHASEIAKLGGEVLGIDFNPNQIEQSAINNQQFKNIRLVKGNFADIELLAGKNNFVPVDGVLFDLGLSMDQLKSSGKGFSYKNLEEKLDMRLDPESEISAGDIVNNLDQNELYEIFARYGEEITSLAISKSVVRARPLTKVADLLSAIDQVRDNDKKKTYARIFQALRIKVNNEQDNLKKGLAGALKIIKQDGRIAVISFHSLEDRIVKKFINQNNLKQINKKIIKSENYLSFERSAKMRIFTN